MEETKKKRGVTSRVICYLASLLLLLGSVVWLALTNQPSEAYGILFVANLFFFFMAFYPKKEEIRSVLTLVVSAMVFIQAFFIVMAAESGAFIQTLFILMPIMLLTAIVCVWYMIDAQSVRLWIALPACVLSIGASVALCTQMNEQRYINEQIQQLKPTQMVIEGIYQRDNLFIVDFEKYGPYVVDKDKLINLNAADTVLVKATKFEVYDIKRKL